MNSQESAAPNTDPAAAPIPLDLSPEAMRTLGEEVLERIVTHLAEVPERHAGGSIESGRIPPAEVEAFCAALPVSPPEAPQPVGPILDQLFEEWIPSSYLTTGPGYLAYVPGGGLFASAIATFIAAATNRFTGVWAAAPILVELEGRAIGWLRDWMGFPATTEGLLTAGGSSSNHTAVICAREKLLGADIRPGTMYVSNEVHHCVTKSARLAGIAPDRVRTIETDARHRMCPEALRAQIDEDRRAGLKPFLVVSSAGTTNTGSVDPLAEIGEIARAEGLWHHIDGAYGAFFHLVPELRPILAGLSAADSLTLDPHKGMFLPYGTGALLVRNGADLRRVHEATAGYLPDLPPTAHYDPSRVGPELSRPYRGLPLWFAVQMHGVDTFRKAIAEKRALALEAAETLRAIPGIELLDDPQLSIISFRAVNPEDGEESESEAEIDRRTRALLEGVNACGQVYLSGATVGDQNGSRYVARICVLCFRTDANRLAAGLDDIRKVRSELS